MGDTAREAGRYYGIESEGMVICVPEPTRAPWRAVVVWRRDDADPLGAGTCQHLAALLQADQEA